jgi:crossover junction endodeoxyribonuclease RusA
MKTVIKGTIYGHPHMKKSSQKVIFHRTLKRNIVVYSAKYTAWANDAKKQLLNHKYKLNIDYPIIFKCLFYFPTRHKKDLSNAYEGIQDVMVTSGVLKDDESRIIIGHDGSRVFYDKEHPRIEWEILKYESTTDE